MERLSHAINRRVDRGDWKSIRLSRNGPSISHLFFADDLVLFAEASMEQMLTIKATLDLFCECSGHKVSVSKTTIYFSKNCDVEERVALANCGGFELVDDLGMYLGVPLLHKRVTTATYRFLLDKIERRLSGWAARTLALAGRITLAKAVIQAIPNYVMQTAWLPKGVCDTIERMIRRFIWGGADGHRGVHLVRWEVLASNVKDGGVGLRHLHRHNEALIMKVGYRLITDTDKLWVQVLRHKYKWEGTLPSSIHRVGSSRLWQGVSQVWEEIRKGICWHIRDGWSTDFWWDCWLDDVGHLAPFSLNASASGGVKVAAMTNAAGQ
ncbi:hypothetical protein like AT3G24255 [Hibiscus trionum]|uniref:Reverse transcriptase domain-containing protein n=1 Tax=Hibiscus trionum TaxID=183268 RepID=A0A9W7LIT6_HIBTR|nr:hypothetical protein like AT3G24255 [Hibiscus trionum]